MNAASLRTAVRRLVAQRSGALVVPLLASATGLCLLLDDYTSLASEAMVYVVTVVIAATWTTLPSALACCAGSVLLLNFFFIYPRFTITPASGENIAALVALLAITVVISKRGDALRRETLQARHSENRARQLQALAIELAGTPSREQITSIGLRFLSQAVGAKCQIELLDAPAPAADLACLAPLPPARGQEGTVKIVSEAGLEGTARVPGCAGLGERSLQHVQAVCSLIAQALARQRLAASARSAAEAARWRQIQNAFLAGISHDFRTPLSAMVAAASSLIVQSEKLGGAEKLQLAQVILDEAAHLGALTENTLQLARLQSASQIRRDWQSVEEIVGSVLARVRRLDPHCRIEACVPVGLPLIKADPMLLGQMLDNLLANALKYTDGPVHLRVCVEGERLLIAVEDRGPGIPVGAEPEIVEPFRRSDRSGQRGPGLGLAVCRAIAAAHEGALAVRCREGGGCRVCVHLPIQPLEFQPEPESLCAS